jgi:hypothetical protein
MGKLKDWLMQHYGDLEAPDEAGPSDKDYYGYPRTGAPPPELPPFHPLGHGLRDTSTKREEVF